MSTEYQKDPVSGERFVDVSDNLRVGEVVVTKDGIFKGLTYHTPVARTLAGALQIFGGDEAALLDAVNSKVQAMVYVRTNSKIRSQLPPDQKEDESITAWVNRHKEDVQNLIAENPVIFTVDDAIGFKPGERELTPQGLVRQLGKLQTEISKLMSEGKMAEAVAKMDAMRVLTERITQLTEALRKQAESATGETE